MLIFDKSERKIPITIVGMQNSGKTTLVQRLVKGELNNIKPTLGMGLETIEHKGVIFQIFDLGGQAPFRQTIWEVYTRMSQGIIFVFDSADREKLDDAKEWFWRAAKWAKKASTVMFLANKWDLPEHMDLTEIIQRLELQRFGKRRDTSFQIFPLSALKGEYETIESAFDWFVTKITQHIAQLTVHPSGIFLYSKDRRKLVDIVQKGEQIPSSSLHKWISTFIDNYDTHGGLGFIETETHRLVTVGKGKLICLVMVPKTDSIAMARILAERVMSDASKALKNSGQVTKDLLKHLVDPNFFSNNNSHAV